MSTLSDIVAKFRAGSPNIAAAFDEVERRLEILEGVGPEPVPAFGADMFLGFEWAKVEPVGTTTTVSTVAQLRAAVAGTAPVVDGGGRTFPLGGQLDLPAHGLPMRQLQNCTFTGGRVRHNNTGKWRVRNVNQSVPPTAEEDCVKGDGGGFLHLDKCALVDAPRQGVLLAPHNDVVISNCIIRGNGISATFDHGIYTAAGSRLLIVNSWFDQNAAYQLHMYPSYSDARVVCNTFTGGRGSILSGITNGIVVGNIFENSARYGLEQLQACVNVQVSDNLGRNNTLGGYSMGSGVTVTRWRSSGSPAGIIAEEFWRFVPPTDGAGNPRLTADAGAYAT